MDIRVSVFPTDIYPMLIAYSSDYKIRNSLANQLLELIYRDSIVSGSIYPYQIKIGTHYRYLDYDKGRAIEKIIDYISHREEKEIYEK